jgi:hypothetical protein
VKSEEVQVNLEDEKNLLRFFETVAVIAFYKGTGDRGMYRIPAESGQNPRRMTFRYIVVPCTTHKIDYTAPHTVLAIRA